MSTDDGARAGEGGRDVTPQRDETRVAGLQIGLHHALEDDLTEYLHATSEHSRSSASNNCDCRRIAVRCLEWRRTLPTRAGDDA